MSIEGLSINGVVHQYKAKSLEPEELLQRVDTDIFPLSFNESFYHADYGAHREFIRYDFEAGKTYKLVATFTHLTGSGTPFSFRTTTEASNTTIAQEIYAEPTTMSGTVYDGKTFEWVFSATADAKYLYCYASSPASTPTIDYTVKLYAERETVVNLIGSYIEKNISQDTTDNTGNSIFTREFFPITLEVGKTYNIYYYVKNWADYGTTAFFTKMGFIIRTNSTGTTAGNVETIIDEYNVSKPAHYSELDKLYHVEFTPTLESSYIYLYATSQPNTGTNESVFIVVEKDATLLNKYDKAVIEEKIDYEKQTLEKSIDEVNNPPYQYSYDGERLKLTKNKFDCSLIMSMNKGTVTTSYQGTAVHNNKLFQLFHGGYCNVYDLETMSSTPVAKFQLGSFDANNNHANNCNFGGFYNGNTIPLLYVTDGNSGEVMKCSVENITESNGTYNATTVQTITLDQSGFESAGLVPYWGWGAWFADADNDVLYYFGAKYRTNGSMDEYYDDNRYIVTTFRLPDISNSTVTLTADDVLDQFTTVYDVNVTQGGTLFDRKIFYTFGFGSTAYPSAIRVYDVAEKALVNQIDLSFITEELEACAVYNGDLLVNTQAGNIYKLTF